MQYITGLNSLSYDTFLEPIPVQNDKYSIVYFGNMNKSEIVTYLGQHSKGREDGGL